MTIILTLHLVQDFTGVLVSERGGMIVLGQTLKCIWLVNTEKTEKYTSCHIGLILGFVKHITSLSTVQMYRNALQKGTKEQAEPMSFFQLMWQSLWQTIQQSH